LVSYIDTFDSFWKPVSHNCIAVYVVIRAGKTVAISHDLSSIFATERSPTAGVIEPFSTMAAIEKVSVEELLTHAFPDFFKIHL